MFFARVLYGGFYNLFNPRPQAPKPETVGLSEGFFKCQPVGLDFTDPGTPISLNYGKFLKSYRGSFKGSCKGSIGFRV